jgi:hypothetical protein
MISARLNLRKRPSGRHSPMEVRMPKKMSHDRGLHNAAYLTISLLYALGCIGFDELAVKAGLAICYFLIYRF